jgi:hypothetical protein|tara:strand:- start:1195 stop:1392 length:198 start_codon:yes stop_codon:yes gene_type:complete
MSNTVTLKKNSSTGNAPSASDLQVGELAVNTADGKLFTKHTDGTVKTISETQISDDATALAIALG